MMKTVIIEDEKKEEYKMLVNNTEVVLTKYVVAETGKNQWSVHYMYENAIYMLRIFGMEQEKVERIVTSLDFP